MHLCRSAAILARAGAASQAPVARGWEPALHQSVANYRRLPHMACTETKRIEVTRDDGGPYSVP